MKIKLSIRRCVGSCADKTNTPPSPFIPYTSRLFVSNTNTNTNVDTHKTLLFKVLEDKRSSCLSI